MYVISIKLTKSKNHILKIKGFKNFLGMDSFLET